MGVKMGWIQIKMGHPLARNGAALAPFRANGAHPSIQQYIDTTTDHITPCSRMRARGKYAAPSSDHKIPPLMRQAKIHS